MAEGERDHKGSLFEPKRYKLKTPYRGLSLDEIRDDMFAPISRCLYTTGSTHESRQSLAYDASFMMQSVSCPVVLGKPPLTVGDKGQEKLVPTQTIHISSDQSFGHRVHDEKIRGLTERENPFSGHQEGCTQKFKTEHDSEDGHSRADVMFSNIWAQVGRMDARDDEDEDNDDDDAGAIRSDMHDAEEKEGADEQQHDAEKDDDVDSNDSEEDIDAKKEGNEEMEVLEKYGNEEPESEDFRKVTLEKSDDLNEIHAHGSKTFSWSFRRMAHRVIQVMDALNIQSSDKVTYNLMIRLLCKPITVPNALRSQWYEIVSRRLECHLVRQNVQRDIGSGALRTLKLRLRKKLSEFVDEFSFDAEDFSDDDEEASADREACLDRRQVDRLRLWTEAEEKMLTKLQWNFHDDQITLGKNPEIEELEEDLIDFAEMFRMSQFEATMRSMKPKERKMRQSKTETERRSHQETGTKSQAGNYQETGRNADAGNHQETGRKSEAGNYQETETKPEAGNYQENETNSEAGNYQETETKSETGNYQETETKSEAGKYQETETKSEAGNCQETGTRSGAGNYKETGAKSEAGNYQETKTKSETENYQETETKSEVGNHQETGTKSEAGNYQETGTKSEAGNYQETDMKSEAGNHQETGTKSEAGNYQETGTKSEAGNHQETGTKSEAGNYQETRTKSEAGNYQETGTKSEAGNYQETGTDSVKTSFQTSTGGSTSVPSEPALSFDKKDEGHRWKMFTEIFDVDFMMDRFQTAQKITFSNTGERRPGVTLSHRLFTHLVLQEPDLSIQQKTLLLWIGSDHGDQTLNDSFWSEVIDVIKYHTRKKHPKPAHKLQSSSKKTSKAPGKETSEASDKETSKAPGKETSRAPGKETSRASSKETSRAPGKETSRASSKETSRAPSKETSRAPSKETSRAPSKETSRAPSKETSRAPSKETSRAHSKAPGKETSRAHSKETSRASSKAPGKETPIAPGKETSKAPSKAPGKETPKAPGKETSKAPGKVPGKETSKAPGKETSKAPGKAPGKETPKAPGKETSKSSGKETSKSSGKEISKAPGKETPKAPGKEIPQTLGKENSKASGKETSKAPGKETAEICGKENSKAPGKETSEISGKENSKAPGKETPETSGKETPKAAPGKETSQAPSKETSQAPSKETSEAPGKETPEAPGKETPKAPGKETPKAPGKETPKAPGKGTPKAPGKETPEVPGKETSKAHSKETSKAPGKETPKAPGKETPKAPGKETPKAPGKERNNIQPERLSEKSVEESALTADLISTVVQQVLFLQEEGNGSVHPYVLQELGMKEVTHTRAGGQTAKMEPVMLVPLPEVGETISLTPGGFKSVQLVHLSEKVKEQVKTVLNQADSAQADITLANKQEQKATTNSADTDPSSDEQAYYGVEVPDAMLRMLASLQHKMAQRGSNTPAIPDLALVWKRGSEPSEDSLQERLQPSWTGAQLEVDLPLETDDCTEWMLERLARVLVHMGYVDEELRAELLASVLSCRNYAERNVFLKFLTHNLETCACQLDDEMIRVGPAAFQQGTIESAFLDKLCRCTTHLCQQLLNYTQLLHLSVRKDETASQPRHAGSSTDDDQNPVSRTEDAEQTSEPLAESHGQFQSVTRSSQTCKFLSESEEVRVRRLLKDVLNDWFVKLVHRDYDGDDLLAEKCKTQIKDKLTETLEISGRDVSTIYDVACIGVTAPFKFESESGLAEQPDASLAKGIPLVGSAEEQALKSQRDAGTQTAIEPGALLSDSDSSRKVLTLEERLVSIPRMSAILALPEMCALSLRTESEDGHQRPLHLDDFKAFVTHVLKDFYVIHPRALHEVVCASVLLAEDYCEESKELIIDTLSGYCRKALSLMVYCAVNQSPQSEQPTPETNSHWSESQDNHPRVLDID